MKNYMFSKHAIEQMNARNISREIVEQILKKPDKSIRIAEEHKIIHQSFVNFEGGNKYLVRVFINISQSPGIIITV